MADAAPLDAAARTALFAETLARHFDGAEIVASDGLCTVKLGFAGVEADCEVHGVNAAGALVSASLFLQLRGGPLGDASTFVSVSGYGADEREAIVVGCCNWACSFGPLLRDALAPSAQGALVPRAQRGAGSAHAPG